MQMDSASGSDAERSRLQGKKRTGASKYDMVKVKVWLGQNMDHHYVLSRFLISRMLTVTRIPPAKATKIALEVKKFLVDHNLLDVKQEEFEATLFRVMQSKGYGQEHIDCYKMVSRFYRLRQPLVILISGAPWTGKSTIAQQLASRLNMPNVMQTAVVHELLRCGAGGALPDTPLHGRSDLQQPQCLVSEFMRECCVVRRGLDGDFKKAVSDGKPLIIEGAHLDPGQYLTELSSLGILLLPEAPSCTSTPGCSAPSTPTRAPHPHHMVPSSSCGPAAALNRSSSLQQANMQQANVAIHPASAFHNEASAPSHPSHLNQTATLSSRSGASSSGASQAATLLGQSSSFNHQCAHAPQPFQPSPLIHVSTMDQPSGPGYQLPSCSHPQGPQPCCYQPCSHAADTPPAVAAAPAAASPTAAAAPRGAGTWLLARQGSIAGSGNLPASLPCSPSRVLPVGSTVVGFGAVGSASTRNRASSSTGCSGATTPAFAAVAAAQQQPRRRWCSFDHNGDGAPAALAVHATTAAVAEAAVAAVLQGVGDATALDDAPVSGHDAHAVRLGLHVRTDGASSAPPSPSVHGGQCANHHAAQPALHQASTAPPTSQQQEQQEQQQQQQQQLHSQQQRQGRQQHAAHQPPLPPPVHHARENHDGHVTAQDAAAQEPQPATSDPHDPSSHLAPSTLPFALPLSPPTHLASAQGPEPASSSKPAADAAAAQPSAPPAAGSAAEPPAAAGTSPQNQQHHQQQQQTAGINATSSQEPAPEPERTQPTRDAAAPIQPLFVPIILQMDELSHRLMAEDALGSAVPMGPCASSPSPLYFPGGTGADSSSKSDIEGMTPPVDATAAGAPDTAGTPPDAPDPAHSQQSQPQQQPQGDAGGGPASGACCVADSLARARLLQEYLVGFEAQGVPVFPVHYGAFGDAVDRLHEYLLQCISTAMHWLGRGAEEEGGPGGIGV